VKIIYEEHGIVQYADGSVLNQHTSRRYSRKQVLAAPTEPNHDGLYDYVSVLFVESVEETVQANAKGEVSE
jgi:hypothetical protein